MKTINLDDNKLKDLLTKKGELITKGRELTDKIEDLEKQMKEVDDKLVLAEKEIDISDIDADAEDITNRFNALKAEMEDVNKRVRERLSEKVPQDLKETYDKLNKEHTALEEERNKIAINAQKYNDKIIPLTKKLLKPFILDEFDDYNMVNVNNGVVEVSIFNHIEEFKDTFRKKKNA
ncbi:MAG: hypothetical protein KA802_10555 [Saprospiraceae bacterium]|nr:hypothetical protein [Saprospiraceae bacterium]